MAAHPDLKPLETSDFIDENSHWNCIQCGACCRALNHITSPTWNAVLNRGDGTCRHLKDNQCSIYEVRPDVCRIPQLSEDAHPQMATWCALLREHFPAPPAEHKDL